MSDHGFSNEFSTSRNSFFIFKAEVFSNHPFHQLDGSDENMSWNSSSNLRSFAIAIGTCAWTAHKIKGNSAWRGCRTKADRIRCYFVEALYKVILRLRPCRRPLWQLQASWLLAWWFGNILIGLDIAGLLGFCCLVFVLLVRSIAMCTRFWMLVFMSFV